MAPVCLPAGREPQVLNPLSSEFSTGQADIRAEVAKLADASALGADTARYAGSNPALGTIKINGLDLPAGRQEARE